MSSDFPSIIHHGTASALDGSPSNENQLGIWALDFSTSTNVPLAMKVTCHSGRGGLSQRFSPTCDSSPFPRSYGVLRRGQVLGLFLDSSIRSYTLHLAGHWLALCNRNSSPTHSTRTRTCTCSCMPCKVRKHIHLLQAAYTTSTRLNADSGDEEGKGVGCAGDEKGGRGFGVWRAREEDIRNDV